MTARDALGNTVTGFTGNVTVAIGTNPGVPLGVLSGTLTRAAVAGVGRGDVLVFLPGEREIREAESRAARRQAELALRESQAEARKLSLVAAKTDNPVMIGASDGRIEWVNEAFCRVMEYAPEEVVGLVNQKRLNILAGPPSLLRMLARLRGQRRPHHLHRHRPQRKRQGKHRVGELDHLQQGDDQSSRGYIMSGHHPSVADELLQGFKPVDKPRAPSFMACSTISRMRCISSAVGALWASFPITSSRRPLCPT